MKSLVLALSLFSANVYAVDPPPYSDMEDKQLSDVECAAVNLYHEARSESDYANTLIMAVVFNRENSLRFPDSICDVVFQNKQFSWTHDGKSDRIKDLEQYDRLYRLAERTILYRQFVIGMSEGVDHYHTFKVRPSWSRSEQMHYVGSADDHLFYSSIK